MAKIESRPLPPINFGTTIREADRSAVYGIIGKELNSILNGADSYYPDAGRKDVQTSHSELKSFIADLRQLQGGVNDPSNILSSVLSDLERIQNGLKRTMDDEEGLDDAIQMKPEFAPNSLDSNILDPDRFQDWIRAPLAPRNIRFQQAEARGQGQNLNSQSLMFEGPNGRAVTDTMGWQNSADESPFESARKAAPIVPYLSVPYGTARSSGQIVENQVPVLRLVPRPQDDPAPASSPRPQVDQSAPGSAAPSASGDISQLLKLRSIIQAVGSRGLFPIP